MALNWTTHEMAEILGATPVGADVSVTGLIHDTRLISPNAMFLALEGEHADGHDFLDQAAKAGAAAALVSHAVDSDLPQVIVEDVLIAAGQLASAWRASLDVTVIGITGSNGKTSVKEMLHAILSSQGPTLATSGNYNNEIGVPITLSRLNSEHRFAVIEMGAAREGDIRYLSHLVKPSVGVLTNAGPAHLESFGSIDTIVRTKGELFGALSDDGWAIINADSDHVRVWRDLAAHCHALHFACEADADFRAEISSTYQMGDAVMVSTPIGSVELTLPVPGKHNVMNALASMAAAYAVGISPEISVKALGSFKSVSQRLQMHRPTEDLVVIDDSYNANPTSAKAGLEVLSNLPSVRWWVMGDMLELGEGAETMHEALGHEAKAMGVDRVMAYGPLSVATVRAFGEGGQWFETQEALIQALTQQLETPASVLVKGSRSMHMDRVVNAVLEGVY